MDRSLFWAIIAMALRGQTQEEQLAQLQAILAQLQPCILMEFHTMFEAMREQAHRPMFCYLIDQLEYEMHGDDWQDFLTWLVMQGREVYTRAVAAPRKVLRFFPDRSTALPAFERAGVVVHEVYEAKTGYRLGEAGSENIVTQVLPVVYVEVIVAGIRGDWTVYLIRHDPDGLSCLDYSGEHTFGSKAEAQRKAKVLRAAYCEEHATILLPRVSA
jgi:hypothetical protein